MSDEFSKTDVLNNKLSNLNIEKWLRIAAFLIFLMSVISIFTSQWGVYVSLNRNNGNFLLLIPTLAMSLINILYSPLILLGLAQIISLMKKND